MDRANKIMDKKISIITATYNAELVFEDLVNSIIPQKTNDIEFIVIDGGSKDNTLNIIKKYNIIKLIKNIINYLIIYLNVHF